MMTKDVSKKALPLHRLSDKKEKKAIKAYGAADRLSFRKKAIKEKFDKRKLKRSLTDQSTA